jgi:3'-5' exoribonuclease
MVVAINATQSSRQDHYVGRYAVLSAIKRFPTSGNGPAFITGELRNRETIVGFIAGRSLRDADGTPSDVDALAEVLSVGRVIEVEGRLQSYNGREQIDICRLRAVPPDEVDPTDFLPTSPLSQEDLLADYERAVRALAPPWSSLVWCVIGDEFKRFAAWPAAKLYHHAWLGGLIEHSLEVAAIARDLGQRWPVVDLDLLVAAALVHDVGKLDAYAVETVFAETDPGCALGHVSLGFARVRDACEVLDVNPFDTTRLLHCIASHHGLPEHGAIVKPSTAEAILLNVADELSAKLAMIQRAVDETPATQDWAERVPGIDGRVWVAAARAAIARVS